MPGEKQRRPLDPAKNRLKVHKGTNARTPPSKAGIQLAGSPATRPAKPKLRCKSARKSVIYYPRYVNKTPNLATTSAKNVYYIHGNYEYYLEKRRKGIIFHRVTHTSGKTYLYRQLYRLSTGKIVSNKFIPKKGGKFGIDVNLTGGKPSLYAKERALNAWLDPWGVKMLLAPSSWKKETTLYEWLFEVKGHKDFGRLYVRGILDIKPEHFRIRQYKAKYLNNAQWKLLESSRKPSGTSTAKPVLDTKWQKVLKF
jgi:hypothetical protein